MEEVHFWRSSDGLDFENKDACIQHELTNRFTALGTDILCLMPSGTPYKTIDSLPDASLLYLGTEEAVALWKDVNEYEGISSNGCGCCEPGMYYCDDYSDWKNLEADIQYLTRLKETILEKRG